MRILLSNDDGINANGISALYKAVKDMGEVIVVAPAEHQSAMSQAITLHRPLKVRKVYNGVFEGYSVDGRPADCVRLALREIIQDKVDLVLSGLNEGANVGINVHYSGTVGAACEGAIMGIPSIAVSSCYDAQNSLDFDRLAEIARKMIDKILACGIKPGDLLNVNIPVLGGGKAPRGVRVVHQSPDHIFDRYQIHERNHEFFSFIPADDYSYGNHHNDKSDVVTVHDGYITVTPLHVDMTHYGRLESLKKLEE